MRRIDFYEVVSIAATDATTRLSVSGRRGTVLGVSLPEEPGYSEADVHYAVDVDGQSYFISRRDLAGRLQCIADRAARLVLSVAMKKSPLVARSRACLPTVEA